MPHWRVSLDKSILMTETQEIFQLFSKVVSTDYLGLKEPERIKTLNILKSISYSSAGTGTEEDNLPYTSDERYLLDLPKLHFLKYKLLRFVNDYMHNTLRYEHNNFKITTSWVAKTTPGTMSHWHNHNNCFFSGVYYVDTYEKCGRLRFSNFETKRYEPTVDEHNILNGREFYLEPSNDKIIMFPAELYHMVAKNNSEHDRYSIAFNVIPIGTIGQGDSQMIIKD